MTDKILHKKKVGKGWSAERRKAQAERCRQNKPWEKSTGPITPRGKSKSSMNALKSGAHSRKMKEFVKMLQANRAFLKHFTEMGEAIAQEKELSKTK